jgi:hypothetical protein
MTAGTLDYRTDPRNPAAHQAAEEAVIAAKASLEEADLLVTNLREALALGRATRGDLVKAQRRLAQQMEAKLQAEARVVALGKAKAAVEMAEREQREQVRRTRAAALSIERDALEAEIAETIARVMGELDVLDRRAGDWLDRASSVQPPEAIPGHGRGPGPGSLTRPSSMFRAWGRATDGLTELQRAFPKKGAPR